MRRVYSYIRFSTPEQADGHSLQRQLDYAQRYAEEHGLLLDDSLSLRDEGLSAYHQAHVTRGALGTFLRAVEGGIVPKGSILIVEGLDRLSRAEPIESQAQLAQIINAGITVVTASDQKTYSRESLKANPMDLILSLLIMIRAHEESDTKSRRVRQAIHARIERWIDGREKGVIRQGRDPRWVRVLWDKSGFELIPEHVAGVHFIIDKYLAGWGAVRITEAMNENGLTAGTPNMSRATVYQIIRNSNLIGEKRLVIDGKEYTLRDYYPSIIDEARWHELQMSAGERGQSGRTGVVPAILTGNRTAYCGYCGTIMTSQNSMNKLRTDGTLPEYARRIMCADAGQHRRCPVSSSVTVWQLERAVLEYCADTMNLSALLEADTLGTEAQARLNQALADHSETTVAVTRMTEQFLSMSQVPSAFVAKVNELEAKAAALSRHIEKARGEVAALRASDRPDLLDQWRALRDGAQALDPDARLQVRELIRQTFRRIDVYIKGFGHGGALVARIAQQAYGADEGIESIDLVLHGRSGIARLLSIEKKSGAWRAAADIDTAALSGRLEKLRKRH